MKKITFLATLSFLFFSLTALAQTGSVKGKVLDAKYPLPSATVKVNGTQKNVITDFDGNFTITGISPGSYSITVGYLGYEQGNEKIMVEPGKVTIVPDVLLKPVSNTLNEVVISSNGGNRLSEARALNIQKNAVNVLNVIAADGIGKLPDRNAAEAVQRIPGVSIERDQGEGRYLAVRGLPAEWGH
ncbi:carboxypeptidase-like regulatory domain-containing protein [Pedobacter frigoris]|uniref:TonB-dependent receptor plug domain-containing protein n=1 Tax=Pedobacter frigoris TaxID=2571272 RepID=A0A4U1CJJ1_9SPHI|nr:carboxypeptidase-like regulatory domain-containing protein [Pedobacter frigoris]TKC07129.1 hypothetical protein FA047_07675 [Pedobacter frigoris]